MAFPPRTAPLFARARIGDIRTMRTVLLSSVAALALSFATGSLAPANAQSAAAPTATAPSPAGNAAPGTTNPSETSAPAAPAASQSDPSGAAPSDQSNATADQPAEAKPAAKPRHHVRRVAEKTDKGAADSGHWAHEPGTGESGPASSRASNIDSADTRSAIAPHLPAPKVSDGATADAYLQAAQAALAAHHTGTAQQALEMAETRLLDRSTPVDAANQPDQNAAVQQVANARKALASGDTKGADSAIQMALAAK